MMNEMYKTKFGSFAWLGITALWLHANPAFAEGAASAAQGLGPFVPLLLMFAIFYFLLIRPQQKKAKLQQKYLSELKKGDRVVTQAGFIGTIKTLSDKLVTLEVDKDVCIKFLRSQILESAESLKATTKAPTKA